MHPSSPTELLRPFYSFAARRIPQNVAPVSECPPFSVAVPEHKSEILSTDNRDPRGTCPVSPWQADHDGWLRSNGRPPCEYDCCLAARIPAPVTLVAISLEVPRGCRRLHPEKECLCLRVQSARFSALSLR